MNEARLIEGASVADVTADRRRAWEKFLSDNRVTISISRLPEGRYYACAIDLKIQTDAGLKMMPLTAMTDSAEQAEELLMHECLGRPLTIERARTVMETIEACL
jgi:hypothetical protein